MAVVNGNELYLIGGETGGFTLFGHHPESLMIGTMTVVADPSLSLFVDPTTGAVQIRNVTSNDIQLDGYSIDSVNGELDPSDDQWQSLADSGVYPG